LFVVLLQLASFINVEALQFCSVDCHLFHPCF
jgi:hypothetical protein